MLSGWVFGRVCYNVDMKIILGSWGLSTEPIIKACEEMVGKSRKKINVAIINEAINGEPGDHRWFAEELTHLTGVIGGNLEFIDIQVHPMSYVKERIAEADVVYCFGGNTDYLANTFFKTGFDKFIPEILEKKVWVGSSAGSCTLCHKESEEIQKAVFKEKREAERFLDIVPIVFLPHLHGHFKFGEEEVKKASGFTDLPVYALSDEAAIVIDGDEPLRVIGEDYILVKKGEVIVGSKR